MRRQRQLEEQEEKRRQDQLRQEQLALEQKRQGTVNNETKVTIKQL